MNSEGRESPPPFRDLLSEFLTIPKPSLEQQKKLKPARVLTSQENLQILQERETERKEQEDLKRKRKEEREKKAKEREKIKKEKEMKRKEKEEKRKERARQQQEKKMKRSVANRGRHATEQVLQEETGNDFELESSPEHTPEQLPG